MNASAQKSEEEERREKKPHLLSWPRQKITHEKKQLGAPHKISFRQLAELEKLHPSVKKARYVEQGEDIEEKMKYKPKHVHKAARVFPVLPSSRPLPESPAPLGSFNGVMDNNTEIPPDIQGAAGPQYVMETTNQQFNIYDKSGNLVTAVDIVDFFSVISAVEFFDPHILYDPNYGQFIICIDDELEDGNSGLGFAVSETSDPTGNWYVYGYDTEIPFNTSTLLDYPEMGYNNNWVVITGNDFTTNGVVGMIYVMDRASLYSGRASAINVFSDNNAFTWVPAQTYDPNQNILYMVQTGNGDNGGAGYMQIGSITGTATEPFYNAGTDVGVEQTFSNNTVDAGQAGSANTINADDSRVQNGVVYINGSLWFTHTVFLPTNNPTYSGVDWWQVNPATLSVLQYGRIADVNKNTNYYYPSLNVNALGDALLGYCISGTDSFYASAGYSFHAATDPASTMQSRYIYKPGQAGYYKTLGGGRNRWGDYTGTAVDPVDNSFWTFGQWAQTGNNWGTQIAHVAPSVPLLLPPNADFTANITSSYCSGFFSFTDHSTETPTSWLWNFGDGTTSAIQNPTHEYTANGTYTVTLTATNAYGHSSKTDTDYVTVDKPSPPVAANVSQCGTSSFSLSASTTNAVAWYDSSGNKLSSSNPYNTPPLSHTTSYWVEDTVLQPVQSLGPATQTTLGTGGFFTNTGGHYLIFDALSPFTLISVLVDASAAETKTFTVTDEFGTIVQSKNVSLTAGVQTVTLNFQIPAGSNYEISVNDIADLWRNNAATGNFYPFTVANVVSITGSDAGNGYYYYFYNWQVQSLPCISARTEVTATVNPAISNVNALITAALCNGAANGQIFLTPSGGSPAYNYKWSNGQTTNPATNLAANTYQVTVTDSKSCTATISETVGQPPVLNVSASPTNSTCSSATGSVSAGVTGGTKNYSYHWNTGAASSTISNLSPNTYSVTITDANSCTASAQATVISSGSINLSVTATSTNCYGSATGSATAIVSGDTNTVHYLWNTGVTTAAINNVVAGNYEVTATDALGCSATAQQGVSQPSEIDISVTANSNQCGTLSGSATATPSNGVPGYSYLWSNSSTSATISGVAANTYRVTVTDAHTCTATASATITNTGSLNLSVVPTAASCNGTKTGSAIANVTGDVNTVSYLWNTSATTSYITSVDAGNYSVTASDSTGCSATTTVAISQPAAISLNITANNIVCGTSAGSATASASGGASGFTYSWSNNLTTASITNLLANTYTVTATDAHSCTATASATIQITGALNLSVVPTATTCFGASTGSAIANVTGDASQVSYHWSTNATTSYITNVPAATYYVTASDITGCSASSSTTVSQPGEVNVSVTANNISCGETSGSATASASGGVSGYTYSWSNGNTTSSITNLIANTYNVTVSDAHNCTASATAVISSSGSLNLSVTPTSVSCNGTSTGSAAAGVTGDANSVNYMWSTAATTAYITDVAAGTYSVTASDTTGCSASAAVTIAQPEVLHVSITSVNIACGLSTGSAIAVVNGGTMTYSYVWSNGASDSSISNLLANTYRVTVTDAHGCTAASSATIINSGSLNLLVTPVSVICYGNSTGSATAQVTGDVNPVNYVWNNHQTTAAINNVSAGTYFVTASDGTGCSASDSVTISQPGALTISVTTVPAGCGLANGSATATGGGGVGEYTYLWSNDSLTAAISELAAAIYSVTVTDSNGCTANNSATVTGGSSLIVNFSIQNVTCFGDSNGAAYATVSSGNLPYTYLWSNGSTDSSISHVSGGNYILTVTDANRCVKIDTTIIGQPAPLIVSITGIHPVCHGGSDGSASAQVTGGTQSYSYLWSDSSQTSTLSNLVAGIYAITVSDTNGCTSSASDTLQAVAAIAAAIDVVNDSCYGEQNASAHLTATGGASPYNFSWSNGNSSDSASSLAAGNYTVTITDINKCTVTVQVSVSQPAQIKIILSSTPAITGQDNGTASIDSISGGTPPYSYNWSNGQTSDTISNLSPGKYTVTVTDQSYCNETASVTVNQTTGISSTSGGFSFAVYPNPAKNEMTIEVNAVNRQTTFSLKDILGQTLVAGVITGAATTLDVSNLADGIYFLQLSQDGKKAVKQVIISR